MCMLADHSVVEVFRLNHIIGQELHMLVHPSSIDLSSHTPRYLTR